MTSDEQIEHALAIAMQAPENVLRAMLGAVYAYRDSGDVQPLVDFADSMAVTVELRALAAAPTGPTGRGRSIRDIFAAHGYQPGE